MTQYLELEQISIECTDKTTARLIQTLIKQHLDNKIVNSKISKFVSYYLEDVAILSNDKIARYKIGEFLTKHTNARDDRWMNLMILN